MIETKLGESFSSRRIASHSCASEASSLGGKNSKLNDGLAASTIAGIDRVNRSARAIDDAVPCAMRPTVDRDRRRPSHRSARCTGASPSPRRLTTIPESMEDAVQTPTDLDVLRRRVQQAIDAQIAGATGSLAEIGDEIAPLVGAVSGLLSGGKGLRAGFLYWGYRAAGGPDSEALVRLAASLEFFQGAALLHDDVMDRSDTRRGMPSARRPSQRCTHERGWDGDGDRFGEGAAILAGDLCLTWCDELYATCGLPAEELALGDTSSTRCARS